MLGLLHVEIAHLSAIGDWLEDSGWTTTICKSEVTRGGVAQSLASGCDV